MSTKDEIPVNSNNDSEDKFMVILNKINGVVQVLEKQSILLREQNATISRLHTKLSVLEAAIGGLRNDTALLKNEIRVTAAKMGNVKSRTDSALDEEELNVANVMPFEKFGLSPLLRGVFSVSVPSINHHHQKMINMEVMKKNNF